MPHIHIHTNYKQCSEPLMVGKKYSNNSKIPRKTTKADKKVHF